MTLSCSPVSFVVVVHFSDGTRLFLILSETQLLHITQSIVYQLLSVLGDIVFNCCSRCFVPCYIIKYSCTSH